MSDNEDVKPDTSKITISVIHEKTAQTFRIKKSRPIGKVLNVFAERIRVERNALRFTFHGQTIRGNEDETPESLDMEDGDQIDAHLQQVGGREAPNLSPIWHI